MSRPFLHSSHFTQAISGRSGHGLPSRWAGKVAAAALLLLTFSIGALNATATETGDTGNATPSSETEEDATSGFFAPHHGLPANAQAGGDALSITPTEDGARLRCAFQKMEGAATREGLWLTSTAATSHADRFRVAASGLGRAGTPGLVLPVAGAVSVADSSVHWERPAVTEEYSVSMDGVRQDFLVTTRPSGEGTLHLDLSLNGATAESVGYGAKLTLSGSKRAIAYSRLRVSDAAGKELTADLKAVAGDHLTVSVNDTDAIYPLRIDPTFSDANWVSFGGVAGLQVNSGTLASYAIAVNKNAGLVYVGGVFSIAGTVSASNVAVWDGTAWSALGLGVNAQVTALAVDNSGNLYAGGAFTTAGAVAANYVAKWNGSAWSAMDSGTSAQVVSLAVDASNNLYAGGGFSTAGAITANCVAKWNGTVWSALGSGIAYNGGSPTVSALAVDASGNLYAGGSFSAAGGVGATNVAKWNGSAWSALSSGVGGGVAALATDGSGNLYAGGGFITAGGVTVNRIAKWNGSAWSALGANAGTNNVVYALATDKSGNLYAGGSFSTAGGVAANFLAKWNGSAWSALGSGVNANVVALAVDGSGVVYPGGTFTTAGGLVVSCVAKYSGTTWSALGAGTDASVSALTTDGGGNLYAGGNFTIIGGTPASHVAKWNGTGWSALGLGTNGQVTTLVFDGLGNLYAGGSFSTAGGASANNIARWNGSTWSALGTGTGGTVAAIVFDGSGLLYAGGSFNNAGGATASNIAKWNGTAWFAVGSGALGGSVSVLTMDGAGNLYAGGGFTTAGAVTANRVAKWNGSAWSPLGTGMDNSVFAMALDKLGNIYAGGQFATAGGTPALGVAKWDGSAWAALGSGLNNGASIKGLASDGADSLYVGGSLNTAGGIAASNVAKWSGTAWSALGSGTSAAITALTLDGAGHLYVGGSFLKAGGKVSAYLARADLSTPVVISLPATGVTASGATLQGTVNADGYSTAVSFDYGTTTAYGMNTAATPTPVTGTGVNAVSAALPGLTTNTTYHFRVVGVNSYGTSNGADQTFTTTNNVATLSSLVLSGVTLSPAFASGTASYTANVPATTGSVTVTPTATAGNASILVNGSSLASGGTSGPILLSYGDNVITTRVTSPDGSNILTYTATLTRLPSNTDTLSNLTLSGAVLSPAFSSATAAYSTTVTSATASLTVTPTATDSNATITVNGAAAASGSAGAAIPLAVGVNNLRIVVTGQDRVTTMTYTVAVNRPGPPILTVPTTPFTVEATSSSGAVAAFTVTATDASGSTLPPTVSPPSGTAFPFGDTTVTASATDAAGTSTSKSFTVRVQDTTPPVLTLPGAPVTASTSNPGGTAVSFTLSASDSVDGAVIPSSNPASGSVFPIGDTTVQVTARDTRGNPASGSFLVRVTGLPTLTVEQPAGSPLTSGTSLANFGTADLGQGAALTFTVFNHGAAPAANLSLSVDGANASDFAPSAIATSVAAGTATTFTVQFRPSGPGTRNAVLHLASNVPGNQSFDILLRGAGSNSVTAVFNTAAEVPLAVHGLSLTPLTLNPVTLTFTPSAGLSLTLVKSDAGTSLTGTFANVQEGGSVPLLFNGSSAGRAIVHYTANAVALTLNVSQALHFPSIGTRSLGDAPFALQASSVAGSSLRYSVDEGGASVSGNLLTITAAGPATVEADASAIGYEFTTAGQTFQVLDAAAHFSGLGDLAGGTFYSRANGVSNGGTAVAGASDDGSTQGVYWTNSSTGLKAVSLQNGAGVTSAAANAISADGSTVAGGGSHTGYEPFLYNIPATAQSSPAPLYPGNLPGYTSGTIQALSADGTVAAGFSSTDAVPGSTVTGCGAFVWTKVGGLVALGSLNGTGGSLATGLSADGLIVVGTSSTSAGGNATEAFIWTAKDGMQGLGSFPNAARTSAALAISGDGAVIVGNSIGAHLQACFWPAGETNPTGLQESAGATESSALAVSNDGGTISGYQVVGGAQVATIWQWTGTAYQGQTVQALLTAQYQLDSSSAATLATWTLTQATAVSPDGFALAGTGTDGAGHPEGWLAVVPRPSRFGFSSATYAATEGDAGVTLTVRKSDGFRGSVTVSLTPGTAIPVDNGVGDYQPPASGTVSFDTQQTSQTITIPLNFNHSPAPGGSRSFTATLTAPSNGSSIVAGAGTATVTIAASDSDDPDGPPLVATPAGALPSLGGLQIFLSDANGGAYRGRVAGQVPGWRLSGESAWRSSGDTVDALTPGDFVVEFESVVNFSTSPVSFLPAPAPTVATVTVGAASTRSIKYPPIAAAQSGTLEVDIAPVSVATNSFLEQRGQWRFLGESEAMWRNDGATIPGLPVGSYLLEFKAVPGYAAIPTHSVEVQPGGLAQVQALYELQEKTAGTLPQVITTLAQATAQQPYEFVGQLKTDIGSGSGVVVAQRVVLTAAHAVFDDATQTYATGLQWQFERVRGQFEPQPLIPRGAYLLEGYAAARVGVPSGVGTPASQELDAAALFFDVPAGNGGYSGYLLSTATSKWLLKPRRKLLVGYPVDTTYVPDANMGQMWATPAQPVPFTPSAQEADVYLTQTISGLAGMSGGPLFTQYDDGRYYPAGIYLGGNQQCVVRGIDAAVEGLIQSAELSSQDGANHVGGGQVIVQNDLTGSSFHPASLTVNFGAGSPNFAAWRLASETTFHAGGVQLHLPTNTSLIVVFNPVSGFATPANFGPFTLHAGEQLTIQASYGQLKAPVITTSALPAGGAGLTYMAQVTAANSPANFTATLTDPLGVATNLATLGLTLSKTGQLSGSIPAGAFRGTYRVSLIAGNAAGSGGARTLDLVISSAGSLSVTFDSAKGSVTPVFPSMLPQNQPVTLTAQAKAPQYIFDSWSGTTAPGQSVHVISRGATLTFAMSSSVSLTANFIPNPYPNVTGTYTGLVHGDADVVSARGMFSAKLNGLGSFTGALSLGTAHYTVIGKFDPQGSYFSVVKSTTRGAGSVALHLEVDLSGASHTINGTATVNGVALLLHASKAAFTTGFPVPQALDQKVYAHYVMALPHPSDPALPQGDGYGTVTVTPGGMVHFVGALGDGTTVTEGAPLGENGEWPFFFIPTAYRSAGVVTGPLTISSTGTIGGTLDWFKPADAAVFYPAGFAISTGRADAIVVTGLPLGATPLAGLTQASFEISGGGLATAIPSIPITFDIHGKGTAGVSGFSLQIVPTTGLFSGKFLDATNRVRNFKGVLLPAFGSDPASGFGLFQGDAASHQTGAVEF